MVSRRVIREFSRRIVCEFKPRRIVLFGSYARGDATPDSDVDLLVVLPFGGSAFRKSVEIVTRTNPDFPVDLLARKPADTQRRYAEGDPLIREALDHGIVLYDQNG